MAERKRVGLVFSYDENWIAGTYYILNIVHALHTLEDSEKPEIIILTGSKENFKKIQNETGYLYLKYCQFPFKKPHYSILDRVINKVSRIVLKKNVIIKVSDKPLLDFVYPKQIKGLSENLKKVNWIPDFQEDYLPQFFTEKEILKRKREQKEVFSKGDIVVLSSIDAELDFKRLYPQANAKTFVLPFAVTHPSFDVESIEYLRQKYNLPENYFFAPNQFWTHKNHIIVLKALKKIKENGGNAVVAMSGKENDYRNENNFNELKEFIKGNGLATQVVFLGFIPREEQLCLFKNAQAIIQPSLFEGWSTVIEDAKALGKFVIASNLRVHKEQLNKNAWFFDPNDSNDLASSIERYQSNPPKFYKLEYKKQIMQFGKKFNQLIRLASQ
jgi:glycosyltransferase involved in cell wall biosynthesis